MATVYGSVVRDGERFKMGYKSGMGVAYAESPDGIAWTKPRLDLTCSCPPAGSAAGLPARRASARVGAT